MAEGAELRQRFAAELARLGLAARSAQLEQLVRPAIRISSTFTQNPDFPVGSSKLGGLPDFPLGVQWPVYKDRPLALMAQLNMAEVAPHDVARVLPNSGMLYFFYDMVDQPWGYDPANRDAWRVIYCAEGRSALTSTSLPHPAPNWYPLPVCRVEFCAELSLPACDSEDVRALALNEEEPDCYGRLVGDCTVGDLLGFPPELDGVHRLLGYPAELQGDIRWEAQLASNGIYLGNGLMDTNEPRIRKLLPGIADWQVLFQMDDDNDGGAGWFGGAGGKLYYSIRRDHLQVRNFDHVWVSFQWQ